MNDDGKYPDQEENDDIFARRPDVKRIISYNLREDQRPSGMKVRYKILIVSGKQAAAIDGRQAEAIKELLLWTRQYRMQQEQQPPSQ